MRNEYGTKYLPAGKLIELLQTLEPDTRLAPNNVANLAIYTKKDEYIGFIDFIAEGEIET